jgi:spore germination protein KB
MDKIRISTAQCFMMGISSITITGHLLFIPVILNRAGRDGWLSLILSIGPILFIGFVVASLAGLYPRKTLTECARLILGKWAGKGIALLFILFFFHETSLALRGFGEFFRGSAEIRVKMGHSLDINSSYDPFFMFNNLIKLLIPFSSISTPVFLDFI